MLYNRLKEILTCLGKVVFGHNESPQQLKEFLSYTEVCVVLQEKKHHNFIQVVEIAV